MIIVRTRWQTYISHYSVLNICLLCNMFNIERFMHLRVIYFVCIVYQQMALCSHKPNLTNIQSVLEELWLINTLSSLSLIASTQQMFHRRSKAHIAHFSRDKYEYTHIPMKRLWKMKDQRMRILFLFFFARCLKTANYGVFSYILHTHTGRYTQKSLFWFRQKPWNGLTTVNGLRCWNLKLLKDLCYLYNWNCVTI